MNSSQEIENILRKLYETIGKFYPEDIEVDYKKYLENPGFVNFFNQNQGVLSVLLDIKKFKIVHISSNVSDYIGYQKEELNENVATALLKLFSPKHRSFVNIFTSWLINVLKTVPEQYKSKQFLSSWGLKLTNKNGTNIQWYISGVPLEYDRFETPILMYISIQDITHLMKGDNYWIRGAFGDKEKKIFVYHSNEDKNLEQDIISERELEVLKYISQGLHTKQIATSLSISPHTVENHRRNMLARTGTRDTTALIQLCKMMGIY